MELRCNACRNMVSYTEEMAGKSLRCPYCEALVQVPGKAKTSPQPAVKPKSAPSTAQNATAKAGKTSATAVKKADATKAPGYEPGKVIKEMAAAQEQSYAAAIWTSWLYPFKTLGVLMFFILGLPALVVIVYALQDYALSWATELGSPEKTKWAVYGISALALFGIIAGFATFSSFLFATCRVGAEGRATTPIIQGLNHKSNISALLAWVAFYFGLGLLVARITASGEQLLNMGNPLVWILLLAGGFLALAGFLLSATVTASKGMDLQQVFVLISRNSAAYTQAVIASIVQTIIFAWAGFKLWDKAIVKLEPGSPEVLVGYLLMFGAGILFLFPAVSYARIAGLFYYYCRKNIDLKIDTLKSENKAALGPQILALCACGLLLSPAISANQITAELYGETGKAREHISNIRRVMRMSGRNFTPNTDAEFQKWLVENNMQVNPVLEKKGIPQPHYRLLYPCQRKTPAEFVWIGETHPTFPDGEKFWVTTFTADKEVNARKVNQRMIDYILETKQLPFEKEVAGLDDTARIRAGNEVARILYSGLVPRDWQSAREKDSKVTQ